MLFRWKYLPAHFRAPIALARVEEVRDDGHIGVAYRPSRRTSPNSEALVEAARDLFARSGPGAVSIRSVAEAAGCSHTLVGRHFGSKAGLEAAVIDRLATGLNVLVTRQCSDPEWSLAAVLKAMRDHPAAAKLILRTALGEFDAAPLVKGHNIAVCLAERVEEVRGGDPRSPSPTAKITAYLTLSSVLGYLALEDFLVHATRSSDVPASMRDAAVVDAGRMIFERGCDTATNLTWETIPPARRKRSAPVAIGGTGEEALLRAAIDLYVERGPGNVTTRDIADRAGVNQGLIYHYYPSREALISRAIETANRPLAEVTEPEGRFDLAPLVRLSPELKPVVIMARYLLDGGRILDVRRHFPVIDAVLARYSSVPVGRGDGSLSDPRLAVLASAATFQATAIVDRVVRGMLKIPASADLGSAQVTTIEFLLSQAD